MGLGPDARVYIAFNDGPYVASPTWTEVTTYVRGFTTHRGRSSDFDQFDTGTAQIVLSNRDRRFDPFYTSGTYYGKLLPRRQVKIEGVANSTTYTVFRGFIAGWPVTWSDAGYDSTVTIQCFDALGLMANEQVPTDWAYYYTQALSPRRYWRFNDSRTSRQAIDYTTTTTPLLIYATSSGTSAFETEPLADGLSGNSLNTLISPFEAGALVTNSARTAYDVTVTFFVKLNQNVTNQITYVRDGALIDFIYDQTTNTTSCAVANGTNRVTYTFQNLPFAVPLHIAIAVTANAGGTPSAVFYRNAELWSPISSSTVAFTTSYDEWGRATRVQIQEFAVFMATLTAAQVTQIYNACTSRFSETTSARMQRILDTTSWPAALEAFPASPVGTVAEIGSGTGVIPELQLVADSEGGELYVSKAGVLTMTARRDVFNATRSANSQATITDSGTGLRYGTELDIQYDADNLKNDVTVNFSGDGEVNATNSVTIATYGAAATTIETQLDSPTSAADLALMELGVEGVLVPQISPIDVSPNTAAADWQTILGLELLDRVTFKRTPTIGNQFNRAALINAIDHQVEPGVWRTQLTLSMRYTSPEILNDDILGRLDYNYLG